MPDALIFFGGTALGAGLMALHKRIVSKAENRARSSARTECERWHQERNSAYEEGYRRGCGAHRDRSERAEYERRKY